MTGLDLLKKEMMARGCNKAQCEAKSLPIILDILAKSNGKYLELASLQNDIEDSREKLENIKRDFKQEMEKYLTAKRHRDNMEAEVKEYWERNWKDIQEYIDRFYAALYQAETEEARDRLRIAQVFVNTAKVDTKYDNTAFIIGLASILTGGDMGAVDELKKINNKIPSPAEVLSIRRRRRL